MSKVIETLREMDQEAALSLEMVALEYMRRRREDDSTPEDDDKLANCELAYAASDYAYWAADQGRPGSHTALLQPNNWPLPIEKWQPRSVRFALVAAASYCLAELTRHIRSAK